MSPRRPRWSIGPAGGGALRWPWLVLGAGLAVLTLGCGRPAVVEAGSSALAATGVAEAPAPGSSAAPTPGGIVDLACVSTGPERCSNARDDNCNGVIDEGCGLATGSAQFIVAWDDELADVDLEVTDPDGDLVEVGRPSASGLRKRRDCPGKGKACGGANVENVVLDGDVPPRGTYRVVVRLEKLGERPPPVAVTLGVRLGTKTYQARVELTSPDDARSYSFSL